CGIRVQNNSHLAAVDIVVEELNSEVTVIANHGDSPIELDSIESRTMSKVGSIIKEGGTNICEASCAHPPQCPIRVDNGRCETAATAFDHNVIVTQKSAVRPGLEPCRMVVAAALIIEMGGRDRGDSSL